MADVEGRGQDVGGVLAQPGEDLRVGPGDPAGGVEQPLAVGVLPDREQQLPDGASARAKSIALRAPTASPSASVRVGVDMTALGDLDDRGGRVLVLCG